MVMVSKAVAEVKDVVEDVIPKYVASIEAFLLLYRAIPLHPEDDLEGSRCILDRDRKGGEDALY